MTEGDAIVAMKLTAQGGGRVLEVTMPSPETLKIGIYEEDDMLSGYEIEVPAERFIALLQRLVDAHRP